MDIGEALRAYLLAKPAIAALVCARMMPDKLDQNATLPALVYHVIDSVSAETLAGPQGSGTAGVATTRIQIDAYAATRIGANALQEAVRRAPLQGYRGPMGDLFANGVSRSGSLRNDSDPPNEGSDVWRYIRMADYLITHTE